jgi:hypothetical protein
MEVSNIEVNKSMSVGLKQTHNGGGLERPVKEKKRSMIAFHEGN